ncbi:MAG: SsrA-binding protein [Alphaproteobacteria bacterium CG_4_9_14_3_um_filter_47_13]|nr:MAG: SsrA-binding protein [Alphaproteobacteria bacterium CG_4_9_14_3_um_filter_47_13]
MAKKKKSKSGLISTNATVSDNRRARYDYHLEDKFEAGIELVGTEVKSLRHGQCSLNESYVGPKGNGIFLFNANIPEYQQASAHFQHEPKRPRKLLLHKKEIDKLVGAVAREGYTIIPTRLYFDGRGRAKLEIALAKGKQQKDKRETIKQREWGREKQRVLKNTD